MGLFSSDISLEEREQQRKEKVLEENNIFEGIECDVVLPEKQLKTSGSSGTKKGIATLAFGIIGWAATSGTSQNEENRIIKNGSMDGSDIRIPYEEIVKMEVVKPENSTTLGVISLLKNKVIIIKIWNMYKEVILNHIANIINERACGAQYEEAGWGIEHGTVEPQETKQESSSLINELERLGNIYEKGLLTEEEFKAMKKKLIGENYEE